MHRGVSIPSVRRVAGCLAGACLLLAGCASPDVGATGPLVADAPAEQLVRHAEPVKTSTPSLEQPPRGIRPPWRENAIPELRRQPGQKPRSAAA